MNQRIGMRAEARLSLCEGKGEGEGMESLLESNPSPLILSPSRRGEVEQSGHRLVNVRTNRI
jgi:hypothetical protein